MPTRIAFSTTWPDRMKELAGKPTRFPEKLIKGLGYGEDREYDILKLFYSLNKEFHPEGYINLNPKTTTIRSNYEYWKSKEGQLIQPFFWSGKPYRSKQVVFCPAVRLARVRWIFINPLINGVLIGKKDIEVLWYSYELDKFSKNEGFEDFTQFKMWFNGYFEGALLEFESVEG